MLVCELALYLSYPCLRTENRILFVECVRSRLRYSGEDKVLQHLHGAIAFEIRARKRDSLYVGVGAGVGKSFCIPVFYCVLGVSNLEIRVWVWVWGGC